MKSYHHENKQNNFSTMTFLLREDFDWDRLEIIRLMHWKIERKFIFPTKSW